MTMKTALRLFLAFSALSSMVITAACGGDDDDGTSTTTTTTTSTSMGGSGGTGGTGVGGSGGSGGGMAVMVPELGTQIDRLGRPAINTALNHTFDPDMATKDMAKDNWNTAAQAEWTSYIPEIAYNLGILDSLDTVCGNQLLADPVLSADRYLGLAAILADDRLWVKFGAATCSGYLSVEANAAGIANNDCGGRRLADDVIDRSYSLLAAGPFGAVGDTISADPVKTAGAAFPYLADPQ